MRNLLEEPGRPATWLRGGIVGLVATALIAAATSPAAETSRHAAPPVSDTAPEWTLGQVDDLIAVIAASRTRGLDPADYGLAALRAERTLCTDLWGTAGSRQLDRLAEAAALALAADYRRPPGDPAQFGSRARSRRRAPTGLDTARRAGHLRQWLTAQAAERT